MDISPVIVAILLASGLVVGFINTLAGGGSAISLTVFMALGLPVHVANGTNRVAIIMQNLSSTLTFTRRGMVDWRRGVRLATPAVVGSVAGSHIAVVIDARVFQICLAVVMIGVLVSMLFGKQLFRAREGEGRPVGWLHYVVFFAIGLYNGYIFVGTGYLILLATLGMLGMDLVASNVVKNFIILLAMPFSLLVFVLNGDVDWMYGLVHGAGNMVGAWLASRYAIGWGVRFLRWFMAGVVLVCLADVLGLISIRAAVLAIVG